MNKFLLIFILGLTLIACEQAEEAIQDAIADNVPESGNESADSGNNSESGNDPDSDDSDSSGSNADAGDNNDDSSSASDDDTDVSSDTTDDNPSDTSTAECSLNSVQQALLDAHNAARAVDRNCGTTFYPATTPLVWDCTLAGIARDHNVDMATNNFFSHTGSDGLSSANRATNAGYDWSRIGENIAAGYSSVESVIQGWIESDGHCANLMQPGYEELGADLYEISGSDYPTYWTANFGTER